MIYGFMTFEGFLWIKRIELSLNFERYQDILILANNEVRKMKKNFIWMHDRASSHRSNSTKDFISKKKVKLLNWPARSPNLNIIENVWGLLSNKIYENQQYRRLDDL